MRMILKTRGEKNGNNITKSYEEDEYAILIEKGNSFIENLDFEKAEEYYINAKEEDSYRSEAYYKLLTLYVERFEVENIKSLIQEIDSTSIENNEELTKLVENEREKDWFPIRVVVSDADGEIQQKASFEYDKKGRIIKSVVGTIPMENGLILGCDYSYKYLSDGRVKIVESYQGDWRETTVYKLDDMGRVISEQDLDEQGEEVSSYEYSYNSDTDTIPSDSSAEIDENGYIVDPHPAFSKRYENEYDNYGNLVRKTVIMKGHKKANISSMDGLDSVSMVEDYEDEEILQFQDYTYVYCKANELNGDVSDFPKSKFDGQ